MNFHAKSRTLALLGGAAIGLAGCASAPSPLRNDASFQAAQKRLQKVSQRVRTSGASASDQALFLQAEGFYEYRFAFPSRGGMAFLAETAAAVTDFPALQSLAESLDMAEARLRSCASAVQLWDLLLRESPSSPLAPLALYRLGWARRDAGISGPDGSSSRDAFERLRREAPGSVLASLAGEAETLPWKRENFAASLSVIPGLGQVYVGEPKSAVLRFLVAVAGVAMVVVPIAVAYERHRDLIWGREWPLIATGFAGAVVIDLDYTQAYEGALAGAIRFNEAREREFLGEHPDAP